MVKTLPELITSFNNFASWIAGQLKLKQDLAQIEHLSASRSLALSDSGKYLRVDSTSAVTLTIPTDTLVPFQIGTEISVRVAGLGTVTIEGDVGVTLDAPAQGSAPLPTYTTVVLKKVGENHWDLID